MAGEAKLREATGGPRGLAYSRISTVVPTGITW